MVACLRTDSGAACTGCASYGPSADCLRRTSRGAQPGPAAGPDQCGAGWRNGQPLSADRSEGRRARSGDGPQRNQHSEPGADRGEGRHRAGAGFGSGGQCLRHRDDDLRLARGDRRRSLHELQRHGDKLICGEVQRQPRQPTLCDLLRRRVDGCQLDCGHQRCGLYHRRNLRHDAAGDGGGDYSGPRVRQLVEWVCGEVFRVGQFPALRDLPERGKRQHHARGHRRRLHRRCVHCGNDDCAGLSDRCGAGAKPIGDDSAGHDFGVSDQADSGGRWDTVFNLYSGRGDQFAGHRFRGGKLAACWLGLAGAVSGGQRLHSADGGRLPGAGADDTGRPDCAGIYRACAGDAVVCGGGSGWNGLGRWEF